MSFSLHTKRVRHYDIDSDSCQLTRDNWRLNVTTSTENVNDTTFFITRKQRLSKRQADILSSLFLSPFILCNVFFISSSICSNDILSLLRCMGSTAWPWNALSVYLASKPSVKRKYFMISSQLTQYSNQYLICKTILYYYFANMC